MSIDFIYALIGGALIGISVTLMLLFMGRVTGISGITYRLAFERPKDYLWRLAFLLGLGAGGALFVEVWPERLLNQLNYGNLQVVIAGLLVGYGTVLGNGCTSGHGVCGISRWSLRSLSATLCFMLSGVITVYLVRVFL